jgi:hypothetical protein
MTQSRQDTSRTAGASGVIQRLRAAWKYELSLLLLRGLAALVAVIAGLVLVDLAADWLLELPGWMRLILLAANAGCIIAAAWKWLRPCMRRFVALHMALRVEQLHRDLESVLVSAVQFQDRAPEAGQSAQLMRAVQRLAQEKTRSIDFKQVGRVGHVPLMILLALLTVGALTSVSVAAPGFLPTLMARMFNPNSQAMYPTRTQIEVLTGDRTVLLGSTVELAARTSGENPSRGQLLVNPGGAGWEEITLEAGEDHRFSAEIKQVVNDTEYYFRLGDARSLVHRISVARPPRIIDARIQRRRPAYTVGENEQAVDEVTNFNIKVPEGTDLTWNLTLDKPVTEAQLVFEDDQKLDFDLGADGRELTVEAPARASLAYQFHMKWKLDGESIAQESPKHFVRVIPDSKPRVAMIYPLGDQQATLEKLLTLTFLAADDYGLKKAWIVYQVNDAAEKRRDIAELAGASQVEKTVEWNVAKTLEDLKEGDLLTYSVEVQDGRPGGGDQSFQRSASRQIQFVSPEEYLNYAMGLRMTYLSQVRRPYQQQREAAKAIRDLIPPAQAPVEVEDDQGPDEGASNSQESGL